MSARSLYIHVPFCKRKCFYCNFYSDVCADKSADRLTDIFVTQLERYGAGFSTIYIGGGTPTALPLNSLKKLLKAAAKASPGAREFTIEANPESLDEERVRLFLDHGVDRISIGVQSFDDIKLKKLGRIHNASKAREAVNIAVKNGIKNIGIDLIFGVWAEKIDSWKEELEEVARLPISHISCYELTYEKDTPLFEAIKNRSIVPIDEDAVGRMYELAIDLLALGGFKQYEVSNFAKEGCESKHNGNYWCNGEYLGIGPAAFSYVGGVRQRNVSDLNEYIKRFEQGEPLTDFSEKLSPVRSAKETAAVKIRTKDGISFEWFKDKTGFDFLQLEKDAVEELLKNDLIKYKKDKNIPAGIMLKRKGLLVCDTVSSALL